MTRLIALLLVVLVALPAGAAELVLRYDIAAGGLPAATAEVRVSPGAERYQMSMQMETVGVIGFFTGFVATARTEGLRTPGGPRPLHTRVDNLWRGEPRWAEAHWRDGLPHFTLQPPPGQDDDRPPVPDTLLPGSIDPLTAGLALAEAAAAGAEGLVLPVFDGRRRYDLQVSRLAAGSVETPVYNGTAMTMTLRWTRLAGFIKPGWFAPAKMPDSARLWYAPPRPETLGLAVPVRIESEGPFGAVVVLLTGTARN